MPRSRDGTALCRAGSAAAVLRSLGGFKCQRRVRGTAAAVGDKAGKGGRGVRAGPFREDKRAAERKPPAGPRYPVPGTSRLELGSLNCTDGQSASADIFLGTLPSYH